MPRLKQDHISPSAEEDATINAGIAADADARELDDDWHRQAHPASAVFGPETGGALIAMQRPRGRPRVAETKVFTAIRLDADVLAFFKATGKGWQTRMNAALRQFINEHQGS